MILGTLPRYFHWHYKKYRSQRLRGTNHLVKYHTLIVTLTEAIFAPHMKKIISNKILGLVNLTNDFNI